MRNHNSRGRIYAVALVLVAFVASQYALAAPAVSIGAEARAALKEMNLRRGICVVLGLPRRGQPGFVTDLAKGSELLVYFQSASAEEVVEVRKAAEASGLLGTRIFAEEGDWRTIHLAGNLAGGVWVAPSARRKVAEKELLRVLHPEGKAILGGREVVKPFPKGTDDWSHPYHGPDNNPQSRDQLARAPYLTQFLAEPKWCPMPQVTVAAGGRLFKAFGHLAHKANQNALLNTLLCINGYNGTVLWTRPLKEGFMIHRNAMVATRQTLYLSDDESCKLIDAVTGEVKGRIVIPEGVADGAVWKWMALEDGVLFALIGGEEVKPAARRSNRGGFGHWPWGMWKGHDYKDPRTNFGYGRTVLAIDPRTKKILWRYREKEFLDSRGVCMKSGRIYFYSPEKFLGCLDAKTGKILWKTSDPELLQAIGPSGRAQHWTTGYATSTYVKCNDRFVFFAGPQRPNLVAVSAANGKLVWQRKDGNRQIVLRDDALYAAGTWKTKCLKLDFETGKELARFPGRRSCTRATGSVDSIFYRAGGGTVRIDVASGGVRHIAPMRPPCQDGVMIAGGLLYWGPWMCGCDLSLYGHICVGPAGEFDYRPGADGSRLEPGRVDNVERTTRPGDWPSYRGNNERTSVTEIAIPSTVRRRWVFQPPFPGVPTAPVAANGIVFLGDRRGIVRALDAADGKLLWRAYTGGMIVFPPAVWRGRVYVGSADGWVYALEAATGRQLWRFRAAPAERRIPVYGRLMSTWPVAGGVVVEDGVLYAAAGIAHYDGTHVYALDAITGEVKWYNDSSGELSPRSKSGISLQGGLYLEGGQLRFSGGNACGTASYDLRTGKCLTAPNDGLKSRRATVFEAYYPRYAAVPLKHTFPDGRTLLYRPTGRGKKGLMLLAPLPFDASKKKEEEREVLWRLPPPLGCRSFVLAPDALVLARSQGARPAVRTGARGTDERYSLDAVDLKDGSAIWTQPLPAKPVTWGSAVDHRGRVFVSLEDGRVLCFEAPN